MISIPKGDTSLPRKDRAETWLHTIEGMQDCASLTMTRFQHGELLSPDVRAIAALLTVALALEKAKRERDNEPAPEDISFDLIPSRSRGLVSGAGG